MTSTKWGILGTGKIARTLLKAIGDSSNAEAVFIASRDAQKARALADEFGVARAGTYDELLLDEEVEAVYNSFPNSLHPEWSIKCARAKKHVLCEKPASLYAWRVEEMFDVARVEGVLVMEAFMYRFHPQWARLQQILDEDTIGKVRLLRSAFTFTMDDFSDARFSFDMEGGALSDVGTYCVNFSRTAAKMANPQAVPVAVFAHAQFHENKTENVDEVLSGVIRFNDGLLAQFFCGLRASFIGDTEIFGETGKIKMPDPWFGGETGQIILNDESLEFPGANNYVLEVEHFSNAIQNKISIDELFLTPQDSIINARVLEALLQSAREGREVAIRTGS